MRFFNATGIAETCSTASLYFIAMPLKYIGGNEILVQVIGPIHGVLWSLYIGLLGLGWLQKEWNMRAVILGGFLSLSPVDRFGWNVDWTTPNICQVRNQSTLNEQTLGCSKIL